MSRQSLDMRYGRQGGRIVEWSKGDPARGLFTKHCEHCGRMMQHVEDFEPICSDCATPSLFDDGSRCFSPTPGDGDAD